MVQGRKFVGFPTRPADPLAGWYRDAGSASVLNAAILQTPAGAARGRGIPRVCHTLGLRLSAAFDRLAIAGILGHGT
jgi:hypothetical protein